MDHPLIRVIVLERPASNKEKAKNDADILEQRGDQMVIVKEIK